MCSLLARHTRTHYNRWKRMDSNGQASKGIRKRRLLYLDWKELDGAAKKKRVLSFRENDENEYICPVNGCLHIAFKSQRGIRKHINSIHPWYFYFDQQPKVNREQAKEPSTSSLRNSTIRYQHSHWNKALD